MEKKPLREIHSEDRTVWITQPHEKTTLVKKTENAFTIAKGKFTESGNIELVMQTAEAFGRGLFADHIKEKPSNWTMKEWLESAAEQIINPMGTGATFTKITDGEAKSLMFRCLLQEKTKEPQMASLFTYGMMRGMFLSAFPNGEVLMGTTIAQGAPMTEFTFKTGATESEKMERERIKTTFVTIMKKT